MPDLSLSSAEVAPPPSPPPPGVVQDAPARDAFQDALRQADSDQSEGPDPSSDEDRADEADGEHREAGDQLVDPRKSKKIAGGRTAAPALAELLGLHAGFSHILARASQSQTDGAPIARPETGLAGSSPSTSTGQAGAPVNFDAFADMLQQIAVDPHPAVALTQSFQVMLGDANPAVTQVEMTRLPDGSLAMTLGTDSQSVSEVRSTLDALRRRLEARGVPIATLSATDGATMASTATETA